MKPTNTKTASMTPRRADVLKYIVEYHRKHGFAPTCREIGRALDRSQVTTYEHIKRLTEMGFIVKGQPGASRNIRATDDGLAWIDQSNPVPELVESLKVLRSIIHDDLTHERQHDHQAELATADALLRKHAPKPATTPAPAGAAA